MLLGNVTTNERMNIKNIHPTKVSTCLYVYILVATFRTPTVVVAVIEFIGMVGVHVIM